MALGEPWAWADRELVRKRATMQFRARAQAINDRQRAEQQAAQQRSQRPTQNVAHAPEKSGGGGWLSKLGDIAGTVGEAISSPKDAVQGAIGQLTHPGNIAKEILSPIPGPFGTTSLAKSGYGVANRWLDKAGIDLPGGEAAQRYQEQGQERFKNATAHLGVGGATAADIVTDPLTWVGPGAVKGALRLAPEAAQGSRLARVAGGVLEQPTRAALGGAIGSGVGAQIADANDIHGLPATALTLGGGILGGGIAARPTEAAKGFNETLARAQGREGLNPALGMGIEDVSGGVTPADALASKPTIPSTHNPADLFHTESPLAVRSREAAYLKSFKGQIDQGLRSTLAKAGLGKLDKNLLKNLDVRPIAVQMRNTIDNKINSYEGLADNLFERAERVGATGAKDATGTYVMPNGARFKDMFEAGMSGGKPDALLHPMDPAVYQQALAAWHALAPGQQQALHAMRDWNTALNRNLQFHGKDMALDPAVEQSYFPQMAVGKNGVEKVAVGQGTRGAVGTKGSFMKDRVNASLAEGMANGINYADDREAWRAMTRAKLRVAGDNYVAEGLKPLGLTEAQVKAAGGDVGFSHVPVSPSAAPALNGLYFDPDVAHKIEGALVSNPGGTGSRIVKGINSALTPIRAVDFMSAFGQQGSAMLLRHPLGAVSGAKETILSSLGDPARYTEMIDGAASKGPGLKELISRGLDFKPGELGDSEFGFRAPAGVSKFVPKPVKAVGNFANETFTRYLNYARVVLANDAWEKAAKTYGVGTQEFDREIEKAMSAVNRMTGTTGRRPSSIESIAEFAPRFFSSAVEQTFAAVTKGGMEGSIARAHLTRMLAFGTVAATAVNELRGYKTDYDPRSTNFLRFRNIGGLDVSPFGTYDTIFRTLATVVGGGAGENPKDIASRVDALTRLGESKLSPAMSVIYDISKGRTYLGKPIDVVRNPVGAAFEIAKQATPFPVQNYIEEGIQPAIETGDPSKLAKGLISQPVSQLGFSNTPVTPSEQRDFAVQGHEGRLGIDAGLPGAGTEDGIAQEKFGAAYADLTGAQKAEVNRDPRVAQLQADVDRNTLSKTNDRSTYRQATLDIGAQVDALSQELESGQISGNDFRDQYRRLQDQMKGVRSVLQTEGGSQDKELSGWFDLYDKAQNPDGSTNWDVLEPLQNDYRAAHPGIDEKLAKAIGTHDNPTVAAYRSAQKTASDYYNIPAYKGMSLEESQAASQVLGIAQDMVSFGQARDMKRALSTIARQSPEGAQMVALARRAQRRGSNPERKKFRQTHPELAAFYSDIATAA